MNGRDPRIALVAVETAGGGFRIGSGYLLRPGLVLTARHVWAGDETVPAPVKAEVQLQGGAWLPAELEWLSSEELDSCLLRVATAPALDSIALGRYDRTEAIDCVCHGYPGAASENERNRRNLSGVGRATLAAGGADHHELLADAAPFGAESWKGMSGAAVFADAPVLRLVGHVRSAPPGFAGNRLWVTPIERIVESCDLLRASDLVIVPGGGLSPNIEVRRPNQGLFSLLNARYGEVAFAEELRRSEWKRLDGWCDGASPVELSLVSGPGGSGKTRFLIEYCRAQRARGWRAGFARDGFAHLLPLLARPGCPTLVVLDYAETRPTLGAELDALIAARGENGPRLRVVLLARAVGDWWRALGERSSTAGELLRADPLHLELRPRDVDIETRRLLFERARRRFAELRGKSFDPHDPDLADDRFGRALYVQMAALAQVEGLPSEPQGLLNEILLREQSLWVDPRLDDGERRRRKKEVSRLMAAVTLRGGVPSLADAASLSRRVSGPGPEVIEHLGSCVSPPLEGREGLAPVEPDLLGENLVVKVLEAAEAGFLERVFEEDSPDALRAGFTVLGRISTRRGEESAVAAAWMLRLLESHPSKRALPAFDAALGLKESSAHGRLGIALATAMEQHGTAQLAELFASRIPDSTVSLRELAAWAEKKCLGALPADAEHSPERAQRLNNLGNRLSALGRREEAFEAVREATERHRALAKAYPDTFLTYLASSLNNLGSRLSELGRREEAFDATREATGIRRALASARPDASLAGLASSLNNLGNRLSDLGRREEAFEAAREAMEIRRTLAKARPDVFVPYLAMSLNNVGNRLSELGRREEALEAAREAAAHYRALATARPDAFLPHLATSLHNLGIRLSQLGRREQGFAAAREATEIRRALARARPDAFLPDLASSLNNLGNMLSELGRRDEAFEAAREATELRRALAKARPDAFLPSFAMSLSNLANTLSALGRRDEAFEAARESTDIRRALAKARPDAFLPDLAVSLCNLGTMLSELGRREEAFTAARESTEIRRTLAKAHPDAFLPDLAVSLGNLAGRLGELGRHQEAFDAAREATEHLRALSNARPEAFLADLARSLNNLGNMHSALGRREEAFDATREASEHYRALANARPDAFLPNLAMALGNLGIRFSELDRREEAFDAAREASEQYRALAKVQPDAFLPDFASSLNNLAVMLSELGHREEAHDAAREATEIRRALAKARPDAFLPDLAMSLNNLATTLSLLGRCEEAFDAAREGSEHYRALAKARPAVFLPYLASSLGILGIMLNELGRREEALEAAREAAEIRKRLENPS